MGPQLVYLKFNILLEKRAVTLSQSCISFIAPSKVKCLQMFTAYILYQLAIRRVICNKVPRKSKTVLRLYVIMWV